MGISLQESNSSHPESATRGISKAELVESSWTVCGRHKRKYLLFGREVSGVITGVYTPFGWDTVSYLIITYPITGTWIIYLIYYSKPGYKVKWLVWKKSAGWVRVSPASLWGGVWDASQLSNYFGNSSLQSIFRISF